MGLSILYDYQKLSLRYKGFVCLATMNYKGTYDAQVYEYIDEPETEFAEIECRLSLHSKAKQTFKDSGEAIKWCFETIEK